jgi:hypothetical protein
MFRRISGKEIRLYVQGISGLFMLLIFLVGCQAPGEKPVGAEPAAARRKVPKPPQLAVSLDNIKMVEGEAGLEAQFNISVKNLSPETVTLYTFVWAHNGLVSPPARGIWPAAAALRNLTITHLLKVSSPEDGWEVRLSPGEEKKTHGAIVVPKRWHDGSPIGANRFSQFRVVLYNGEGAKVFDRRR